MSDNLAWGGYSNGYIPNNAMDSCGNFAPIYPEVTVANLSNQLRTDADRQLALLQMEFERVFQTPLNVSEAYRSRDRQNSLWYAYQYHNGALAAPPGSSRHGWGLAVDFGSGVGSYGTKWKAWMDANAPKYGWVPEGNNFSPREAWHFEFTGKPTIIAAGGGTTPVEEDDMYTDADRKRDDQAAHDAAAARANSNQANDRALKALTQARDNDDAIAALSKKLFDPKKGMGYVVLSYMMTSGQTVSAAMRTIANAVTNGKVPLRK